MNPDQQALAHFGGVARLFPLPNLVLFPHVVQPLHVFEPRYRQMMADALGDDRLLTLVLLRPGWEDDYDGRPALHPIACLGRIVAEQQLPDGRYNLLLRGLSRVRIVEEVHTAKLYRSARVELLPDLAPGELADTMTLRRRLAESVLPRADGPAREQLRELFQGELSLGALCDVLAYALPLPPEQKQELLDQTGVADRAEAMLRILAAPAPHAAAGDGRKFPPEFSPN